MAPIVAAATALVSTTDLAVPLPRYAQIVGYSECEFFGVNFDTTPGDLCATIWTKPQRDRLLRYLFEAQNEIEQTVGYPLTPRWITNDEQRYSNSIMARWSRLIEPGVRAEGDIALAAVVDHSTDPATVGPLATTVTDEDEVYVYHPGTDIEIVPSGVSISAGNLTIEIPRCRMVTEAASDNPETGLDYTDPSNFEAAVDVKQVYNDLSIEATIVWPGLSSSCCASCADTEQDGCIVVLDSEIGNVKTHLATYSAGTWRRGILSCYCCSPQRVRLNYRAGMSPTTRQAEDAVIRLAHAKMPASPCGCDVAERVWTRDRHVPEALTRERANCDYGMSDGAWAAWRFANAMRVVRGSSL